jgi:hypothetical protein
MHLSRRVIYDFHLLSYHVLPPARLRCQDKFWSFSFLVFHRHFHVELILKYFLFSGIIFHGDYRSVWGY